MPLAVMFDVVGRGAQPRVIRAEVMRAGRFEAVRTLDSTAGLSRSGGVLFYIGRPADETRLFGRDAHWLKLTLHGGDGVPARVMERVVTNAVTAAAVQDAGEQYFSAGDPSSPSRFELLELPVRGAELAVMENGEWKRWRRINSLKFAGIGEEVFELDRETGVIRFGTGMFGKAPPRGDQNIRVKYTFGGGANGNLPKGAVDSLVGSVPRITGVTNVTPMSGGADAAPQEKAERLGRNRFRHRFVPASRRDFEDIVIERFERAAMVRCYPGVNGLGGLTPGHVTVAVAFNGHDDDIAAEMLCADIFKYLSRLCDCNLAAGRLHVLPAIEITVDTECVVTLRDADAAQETVTTLCKKLGELIDELRAERGIGSAIGADELASAVTGEPNVASLRRLVVSGRYKSEGEKRMLAHEDFGKLPFCIPRSGTHIITVV
jgi:hypothetical protein